MMFSTQGAIASRGFDFNFSDELVVVGHVPLNRKRGQKQLQKIAQQNQVQQPKHQPKQPKQQQPKAQQKPAGPRGRGRDRKADPWATTYTAWAKPEPVAPVALVERVAPAARVAPVVRAPVTVQAAVAVVPALELPAETLAQVAQFAGWQAIGGLAATGRHAYHTVWAGSSASPFWRAAGHAGWDACRKHVFGLGPGWAVALERQAASEPLAALEQMAALCGALLASEQTEAAAVLRALCAAGALAGAAALPLLDECVGKLRTEVYGPVGPVLEQRDQCLELQIVAKIGEDQDREHQRMAFDYFAAPEPEPVDAGAFWDELEAMTPKGAPLDFDLDFDAEAEELLEAAESQEIPEATSRALAGEFLEAMGLHHGFEWQETAAAMTAVER